VSQKNVPLCDCSYLRQILTDFHNFYSQTLWTSSSNRDKALTKNFYELEKYSSQRILAEFLKINRNRAGLGDVTKKIWKTESTEQRHENCKMKHAGAEENVTTVDALVALLNYEGQTNTPFNTPDIHNFGLKCLSSSNTLDA